MFNNNDYVVHPRAGVCRITDTIEMPLQPMVQRNRLYITFFSR